MAMTQHRPYVWIDEPDQDAHVKDFREIEAKRMPYLMGFLGTMAFESSLATLGTLYGAPRRPSQKLRDTLIQTGLQIASKL